MRADRACVTGWLHMTRNGGGVMGWGGKRRGAARNSSRTLRLGARTSPHPRVDVATHPLAKPHRNVAGIRPPVPNVAAPAA